MSKKASGRRSVAGMSSFSLVLRCFESGPASARRQFAILFRSKRERHRDRDSAGIGTGSGHMECPSWQVKGRSHDEIDQLPSISRSS